MAISRLSAKLGQIDKRLVLAHSEIAGGSRQLGLKGCGDTQRRATVLATGAGRSASLPGCHRDRVAHQSDARVSFASSAGGVAVASLVWAGVHVVQELVLQPPAFHDIGPTAIMGYRRDPALATMKPEEIQAQAFYDLSDAAQENAKLIERAHEHLSAAYGVFAVGLVAAAIAIVALVLSLI